MNPLKPIFLHTLSEIEVVKNMGDSVKIVHPISNKEVVRKLHRSTVWHKGKKAEYIWIDAIRYFAV